MFTRQVLSEAQALAEKAEYESRGHTVWSISKGLGPNRKTEVWTLSVSVDNDANRHLWEA